MTMGRVLAALALAVYPAVAAAGPITFQNCSTLWLDVILVRSDSNTISAQTALAPGASVNLNCAVATCGVQIYYNGPTTTVGNFPGPYSDNRCTRGVVDVPVATLPPIGNCGC